MSFLLTDYNRGEKLIFEGCHARIARSPHRVKLPSQYSPDLAYLAGYHLGDGYLDNYEKVSRRGGFEILYVDEYEKQITDVISPIIKKNFEIAINIRKRPNNLWIGRVTCKAVHIFLHQILKMPLGRKGNFDVPDWVLKNREFLRAFISGFFDAEGSIFLDKFGKVSICLTNSNRSFLVQIQELLKIQFGIEFYPIYQKHNQNNGFEMKIRAKEIILRFCKEIGFRHPYKIEKMQECLKRLETVHSRKHLI